MSRPKGHRKLCPCVVCQTVRRKRAPKKKRSPGSAIAIPGQSRVGWLEHDLKVYVENVERHHGEATDLERQAAEHRRRGRAHTRGSIGLFVLAAASSALNFSTLSVVAVVVLAVGALAWAAVAGRAALRASAAAATARATMVGYAEEVMELDERLLRARIKDVADGSHR